MDGFICSLSVVNAIIGFDYETVDVNTQNRELETVTDTYRPMGPFDIP